MNARFWTTIVMLSFSCGALHASSATPTPYEGPAVEPYAWSTPTPYPEPIWEPSPAATPASTPVPESDLDWESAWEILHRTFWPPSPEADDIPISRNPSFLYWELLPFFQPEESLPDAFVADPMPREEGPYLPGSNQADKTAFDSLDALTQTALPVGQNYNGLRMVNFPRASADAKSIAQRAQTANALELHGLGLELYRTVLVYESDVKKMNAMREKLKKAHDQYTKDIAAAGDTDPAKAMKRLYERKKAELDPDLLMPGNPVEMLQAKMDLVDAARVLVQRGVIRIGNPF